MELKLSDSYPSRRFRCDWDTCIKGFSRKSDLQRHYRVHTNERPHTCAVPGCGKSFIQRSALIIHVRTHTGEKPHHCLHLGCGKRFSDSSSLARHRRIHAGKRQCEDGDNSCLENVCCKSAITGNQYYLQDADSRGIGTIEQCISESKVHDWPAAPIRSPIFTSSCTADNYVLNCSSSLSNPQSFTQSVYRSGDLSEASTFLISESAASIPFDYTNQELPDLANVNNSMEAMIRSSNGCSTMSGPFYYQDMSVIPSAQLYPSTSPSSEGSPLEYEGSCLVLNPRPATFVLCNTVGTQYVSSEVVGDLCYQRSIVDNTSMDAYHSFETLSWDIVDLE